MTAHGAAVPATERPHRAQHTAAQFAAVYGATPTGTWAAPGRVNLIGEHTDYNDGFVMPLALPHTTLAAASARTEGVLRLHSGGADGGIVELRLDELRPTPQGGWAAYPAGCRLGDAGGRSARRRRGSALREHGAHRRRTLLLRRPGGRHRARPQRPLRTRPGAAAAGAARPAGRERLRRRALRNHGPDRRGLLHRGPRPVPGHPRPHPAPGPVRPGGGGAAAPRGGHPGEA